MHARELPDAPTANTEPRSYGDAHLSRGERIVRSGNEVVVLGNTQARAVAEDPARFSSAVSRFMQLPNGLDGEEHERFRALIDAYLTPDALTPYAPAFREAARSVVADVQGAQLDADGGEVDAVATIGARYAVRAMLAWLGWPADMEDRLVDWVAENNAATRSGQLERTAAVAEAFDAMIHEAVDAAKESQTAKAADAAGQPSVTLQLLNDTSIGRHLEFDELVSVLRNWTAGDLSSMAYCVGVLLYALGNDAALQDRLRSGVSEREFTAIADEVLRQDSPFVSNRRVTTCPVDLDGVELDEGQRVRIHWTAANRDPEHPSNLVWGAGPHACPGKYLSMLELRCLTEELLRAFSVGEVAADAGRREQFPVGGWASLPVTLNPRR